MTGERAQQPLPFAYVHTPKAATYRRIMRAFVERKRRFLVHSRPEDIAEALGEESVESALSALVEWGNLATHRPRNDGGVTVERGTVETARLALAAADATRAGCRNRIIRYDCSVVRTISATTAVKRFREVLNDVEYRRETFEVERHGRPVARIGPTSQMALGGVGWKAPWRS